MKQPEEEPSVRLFVVALYGVLAALVAALFIYEDEVKLRIETRFAPRVQIVEVSTVEALPPRNAEDRIFLIDYKLACETYNYFAGGTLGATTIIEMAALIATDSTFTKLYANDHTIVYWRAGWGGIQTQTVAFLFDEQQVLAGAVVHTPNMTLALLKRFVTDMDEWHPCLGEALEFHEDLPGNEHLDNFRFVYPSNLVVNLFVVSSPAVVVDGLIDFAYMISTPGKEEMFKKLLMEIIKDGTKKTKRLVPDLRKPDQA